MQQCLGLFTNGIEVFQLVRPGFFFEQQSGNTAYNIQGGANFLAYSGKKLLFIFFALVSPLFFLFNGFSLLANNTEKNES